MFPTPPIPRQAPQPWMQMYSDSHVDRGWTRIVRIASGLPDCFRFHLMPESAMLAVR